MWRFSLEGDTNDDLWSVTNREGGKGWCHKHDKFPKEESNDIVGVISFQGKKAEMCRL
jgi:hypothetical protein